MSTDQLATSALLPLLDTTAGLDLEVLSPSGGKFDTHALSELAVPAQTAAEAAGAAAAAVQEIDRVPLVGAVARAVNSADDVLTRSAAAMDALARASKLVPTMLGRDGPRSYLLLVQNNAEWRSLGGISGTAVLIRTDQGRVSLGSSASATALSRSLTSPIVELPDDIQSIYKTRPARWFHDLTEIPDFTVDGPLAREMFRKQTGVDVDGVLAVDPVVLSYLLKATGPVALPDGSTLTADNAVPLFLSDVYAKFPKPTDQDAFFAGATGAIFSAFLNGQGSTPTLLTQLARGAEEHRLFLWSAREEEQAVLAGSTLAGELPESDDQTARIGVYLNDGTGSKMSYYLKPVVSLQWGRCGSGTDASSRELTLTSTLVSTAPADAQTTLPTYVTGNGALGTAPGSAATVTNVYLPPGWELVSATTSNGLNPVSATLDGRQVLTFDSILAPQQSASFTVVIRATTTSTEAEAWVTPTADASIAPIVTAACDQTGVATLE
ncbi:DUF4012 domain-containing protein [uncultured Microbacterium sp.]|uniref:DUF4012 domain-containing protein n=1 Tax=uncultured Microbacterium sp. TaxID=191216 RepID=UPI0025E6107E|nr:DUF4012 domain-containing protein [uncultured Microbacterium sp.]